ncbi:hypothetical protein FUT69_10730 [Xylella taiwanensis]|uniref:Uncharacterized protein n=1 Tax=Xylella taiwanensis TaxID=1444770 RepID=A0ABS8TT04_9GAMM|nr:hypothetical protein [Xylella taiwanensis]MCD8456879.1 hypothetical protein [Xylella taiwanensis]MCD8459290.1 hypothetical protein [Xylella taiwanensis]MCD8461839.1 hypothetical protein [Xylella taiwanensis]MCD8462129.1 hypothetical protein [Xylella taiwanensis]MCD8465915.1 hypothetical protein [Xylella taiwanensis]
MLLVVRGVGDVGSIRHVCCSDIAPWLISSPRDLFSLLRDFRGWNTTFKFLSDAVEILPNLQCSKVVFGTMMATLESNKDDTEKIKLNGFSAFWNTIRVFFYITLATTNKQSHTKGN